MEDIINIRKTLLKEMKLQGHTKETLQVATGLSLVTIVRFFRINTALYKTETPWPNSLTMVTIAKELGFKLTLTKEEL